MKVSDIEVKLIESMGSDLSVVNAARVSFDKESTWLTPDGCPLVGYLWDKDERLINYLAKHKHYSPFNHTFLTFRIKAPIFVARQLVKHEYLPWNEVSRRYVDSEPEFYMPGVGKWRSKADNVKQGSGEEGAQLQPLYEGQEDLWGDFDNKFDPDIHVSVVINECFRLYQDLLKSGICAEQARMVLPQNVMTEWIWSGTLKAFHKMLSLRLDPHTQYETRIVAEKILPLIEQHFPVSIKALLNESE